ncbi:hypothetical protein ACFLU5_14420 [Bacteroidota bacterium]
MPTLYNEGVRIKVPCRIHDRYMTGNKNKTPADREAMNRGSFN